MSIKKTFSVLAVGLLAGALVAGTGDMERTLVSTLTDVSPTPVSVGSLAFGPENILFVGDTQGGAIYAMDLADMAHGDGGAVELDGVDRKIASLLGIAVEDLLISDIRSEGKWFLLPLLVVFFLVGGLVVLGATGAAPLLYALF